MHGVNIWGMLDIEPTGDTKQIKKAYSRQLKRYHPETDPEGYQRLRSAYDTAMRMSKLNINYESKQEQPARNDERPEAQSNEQVATHEEQREEAIQPEGSTPEIDWQYGDGEYRRETGEMPAERLGKRVKVDWQYGNADDPVTGQQEGAALEPVAELGKDEQLANFIQEAGELLCDPECRNDTLLWADLLNRYDDIIWDSNFHDITSQKLFSTIAENAFVPETKLWNMLEACFNWSKDIIRNRVHYDREYGELYIKQYMVYADDPVADARLRQQNATRNKAKAKGKRKKSIVLILIAMMVPNILRLIMWESRTPVIQDIPRPIGAAAQHTLDINDLLDKSPVLSSMMFLDIGSDIDDSIFAPFGQVGYDTEQSAIAGLKEIIQNKDWRALADYVDIYPLIGDFYQNLQAGDDPCELFALLMDTKAEELLEIDESSLLQREGKWLLTFPTARFGGDVNKVLLYCQPDKDENHSKLSDKQNAVLPLYMVRTDEETVVSMLYIGEEDIASLEVTTVDYKYDMQLEGVDRGEPYVINLHFDEEANRITSIYGIAEDGERVAMERIR